MQEEGRAVKLVRRHLTWTVLHRITSTIHGDQIVRWNSLPSLPNRPKKGGPIIVKSNLTQAQSLLVQSFIPLVAGVIVTTATTGYQAFLTGHVDPNMIGSFLLATFLATLGQTLKAYIPQHIPQELQALKDTQDEILSIVNGFTVPRVAIPKQPTGPTAVVPAFTPPARPATIQATTLPDVPQQPFLGAPPAQPPTPDTGG